MYTYHTHLVLSNTIGSFKTSQYDRYHPISAKIFWETIQEESDDITVTGYRVQVEGPDSTQVIPKTNKYSTFVEIPDLLPSTQYTFEVSAMTLSIASTTPQRGETSIPYEYSYYDYLGCPLIMQIRSRPGCDSLAGTYTVVITGGYGWEGLGRSARGWVTNS